MASFRGMQSVLNGFAQTTGSFGLGDLSSPILANMPSGGTLVVVLCLLAIFIPIGLLIASFPLWIAAKIAVSSHTTYGQAVKVMVSQSLVALLIWVASLIVAMMAGLAAGQGAARSVSIVFSVITFVAAIIVTARGYEIGTLHAFGVRLLSFVITVVFVCIAFFGAAAIIGGAAMHEHFASSLQRIQSIRQNGSVAGGLLPTREPAPLVPAPSAPAFAANQSAEIDGLLNAAMHPYGPRISLADREDIVRTLQEKLRTEKSSLPAGDAHAALVFQNQLNRYLALLDEVKAERKLHPLRDEVVTGKPSGRDYASPAH